jgi:hypothetical protein
MNYELAKQLKDAGFPHDWAEFGGNLVDGFSPTLEELIEACVGASLVKVDPRNYPHCQICGARPAENYRVKWYFTWHVKRYGAARA